MKRKYDEPLKKIAFNFNLRHYMVVETPVDMVFPVVFGAVLGPMCGLNPAGRAWFLTTLALQSAAWLAFNAGYQADVSSPCGGVWYIDSLVLIAIVFGDLTIPKLGRR